jgi:hypothetical protein
MTDRRVQKAAAWSGVVCLVVFLVGVVAIARMIPPPSPDKSPEQVAAFFRDHQDRIRTGSYVLFLAAGFLNFFVAAISQQLKRMPGAHASMLAQTQLVSGALGTFMFLWAPMFWIAATFRPEERSPETLATLYDLAYLAWIGNAAWVIAQGVAIAVAVFTDGSERPVFPRWVGYFNVWVVILYVPSALDLFFTSGMFSWNGLIVFYIPTAAFFVWLVVMTWALLLAIDEDRLSPMHAKEIGDQDLHEVWGHRLRGDQAPIGQRTNQDAE